MPRGRLRSALLAAALIAGAAALLHTRSFLLTRLVISGLHQVTTAEIEADLALPSGTYAWQVRPWVLARRLTADPLIAHAQVRLLWPNGVKVALTERVPSALILDGQTAWEVGDGGLLLRALPDETGATTVSAPGLPPDLPMVVGAHLSAPIAGQPVKDPGLIAALGVAASLGGTAGRQISAVTIAPGGAVGVITQAGTPVAYGNGSDAAHKTADLLGILACAQGLGVQIASIDLSAPMTPAVRTRPGSPPWPRCPVQATAPGT